MIFIIWEKVGGNKVQIHLNDDDEDDSQEENGIKSEDKIHIDEDDEEDDK